MNGSRNPRESIVWRRRAPWPLSCPGLVPVCVLILFHRVEADHPVVVAANRDESPGRRSSPPGIRPGPPRILCPADRQAGGTWIGFNELGLFAGITNRSDLPQHEG